MSLSIPSSVSDDAQGKSVSIEFAEISFRQVETTLILDLLLRGFYVKDLGN